MFRSAKPQPDTRPCPVTQQRCVRGCPNECQRIQVSRRRFLFLGTAAAAAVVAAPYVELIAPVGVGLDTTAINGILSDAYGPLISKQINTRILITAEMIQDSVRGGAFVRAIREEHDAIMKLVQRDFERRLR